jgi:hypothetical protein
VQKHSIELPALDSIRGEILARIADDEGDLRPRASAFFDRQESKRTGNGGIVHVEAALLGLLTGGLPELQRILTSNGSMPSNTRLAFPVRRSS